jgi:nitrite reductase (NO-forming)
VALAEVAIGAALATLYLAAWPPVTDAWGRLKPAHGWLNLVGFVSLVIATTLLHFFPTVVGARIANHRSARVTVIGLAVGPPVVALGFAFGSDALGRLGALLVLSGAWALPLYARRAWQTRARWTTDPGWHRFAMTGLVSAIAWFEVGIAIAAGRVLASGTDPGGWSVDVVIAPLVVGWAGIAVLASASHLIPAIGPGDPAAHARQRALLGRVAEGRLVALDVGVAALAVGVPLGVVPLVAVGALVAAGGFVPTALALAGAVLVGVRGSRPAARL